MDERRVFDCREFALFIVGNEINVYLKRYDGSLVGYRLKPKFFRIVDGGVDVLKNYE